LKKNFLESKKKNASVAQQEVPDEATAGVMVGRGGMVLKMFCNQHLLGAIRGELSFGLEQEEWGREGGETGAGGGEGCKRRCMHKCSTRVWLRFALLSLKVSTCGFLGTRGICLRYITNITANSS